MKKTKVLIYKKIGKWPGEFWDERLRNKDTIAVFNKYYDKENFRLVEVRPYRLEEGSK
jgi:hypothetical protein